MKGLSTERSEIADDVLASLGEILIRSQFGGFGLWWAKTMFAVLSDGELYLRAQDELKSRFIKNGMMEFVYTKRGLPVKLSYYRVEVDIWQDKVLFRRLVLASLRQSVCQKSRQSVQKTRLRTLPNIGCTMERGLYRVGVTCVEQLFLLGAVEAFIRLKMRNKNLHNRALFDLAGAVTGCHQAVLPVPLRTELTIWLQNNAYRWDKK